MYSVDFGPIETLQRQGDWPRLTDAMADAARRLTTAGADCIVICSNTMHKTVDAMQDTVNVPVLHIADATAEKIKSKGMKKVGLMGTKFTMEGDFYKNRLKEKHNIEVVIPHEAERKLINNIIFQEICLGIRKQSSKDKLKEIIDELVLNGAEGIILGCTEIPLLIKQEDTHTPIFDTMTIHAVTAAEYALQ
jgi:aspartate racemase